ncbi:SH3 domain-containing protein [Helicobacter sp. MIT 99-5507]|uniref:SH3 domain-containing protein n=1 Tax=Helicobacter sp. MIT 99-5507 TaxID=152489 RepID=UPI000E1FAC8A|nr:SH3 domain-containing protein [Helicobacter sp. MIT 99-5507]RDU58086.1 hypothetical protein CQA42_04085 [Helicobacter sp. MIT 99-5507]
MQGKYKIYISYIMVMLIGVVLFILFILFIEKRNKINLEEIVTTAPIQTSPSLNKDLEEPIKMIDNIEALNTKEEDIKNIYRVVTNILNIREKPNTESKIIRQYINGNNIEIININGQWGELKNGGFAYMGLLEKNDDKNAEIASNDGVTPYIIKVKNLNIREKPNTESKIIRQMHINQKIFIENIEGKWGKVAGGGFVYMELLSKK